MRAVMPVLLPEVEALRRKSGADQWDEMWDGVLHMPPLAGSRHQDLSEDLLVYVRYYWAKPRKAQVAGQRNLSRPGAGDNWRDDYRIPDLLLLTRGHFHVRKESHWEGAPNAVVEIHSPGDEAFEKLDFYRDLGVPEVWIIDGDTCQPEIYLLTNGEYEKQKPSRLGWLHSPLTKFEMRGTRKRKLAIRVQGDDSTRAELPEHR